MLGRAIHHASTVPVEPETDVIAMGDRNTLMPEETEPAPPEEAPVVVPQIQRPVADGATVSLGDAIDSQYAVLITAECERPDPSRIPDQDYVADRGL